MNLTNDVTRILVVDDEFGIREGCRKILTAEGYDVQTAEDGLTGWEWFQQEKNFAAAFIDLKMPKMDGIELIQRIHEEDKQIILFVITAYATIQTAVEVTKKGAYGYIPKPFTPDELLLPLRHGLERQYLQKQIAQLQQEREQQLLELTFERSVAATILKSLTDGVLVCNREGQLVLQNAAAAKMLMGHVVPPFPSFLLESFDCQDMTRLLRAVSDADSTNTVLSKELILGASIYMINISPILGDANGGISGIVAVLRDVTALKPA